MYRFKSFTRSRQPDPNAPCRAAGMIEKEQRPVVTAKGVKEPRQSAYDDRDEAVPLRTIAFVPDPPDSLRLHRRLSSEVALPSDVRLLDPDRDPSATPAVGEDDVRVSRAGLPIPGDRVARCERRDTSGLIWA